MDAAMVVTVTCAVVGAAGPVIAAVIQVRCRHPGPPGPDKAAFDGTRRVLPPDDDR
ncbi:MAG: hypothetical protein J2P25_15430 [Nocardiopsaceae bacterium]|nr:hypothetical protein [Nocardiopsaceae bacterium]